MFGGFDTSVSGLVASRVWKDTIDSNLANMYTTRDAAGNPTPYQRRFPVFMADGQGVRVASIEQSDEYVLVDNPGHPDAIKDGPLAGKVKMPAVDWPTEMVNAIAAQRAYEANITALQVSKQMFMSDLGILA